MEKGELNVKQGKSKNFGRRRGRKETRLILQLVPFFMGLLDDGQFGMWISNRKSAVRRVPGAVQHQRPFLYESRLRSLGVEAYLQRDVIQNVTLRRIWYALYFHNRLIPNMQYAICNWHSSATLTEIFLSLLRFSTLTEVFLP